MQRAKDKAILVIAALAASATLVVAAIGCEPDDVGIPCDIGATDDTDQNQNVQINTQATDCRSRLCMKYAIFKTTVSPVCTKPCDSDSDCPDDSPTCKEGYKCLIGQTVEGGLQCCKLCVCRSDINLQNNVDPQQTNCTGKAAKCPNI